MQQVPIMPRMSPEEERRQKKDRVRLLNMLRNHLQAAAALLDAIDSGVITTDMPRKTARQIQLTFTESRDRDLRRGVVGEVLAQVGVFPRGAGFVQPWQIVEARDALRKLADVLPGEMDRVQRLLGR